MKYFAYGSNLNADDLSAWCTKNHKPTLKLSNPVPFRLDNYKLGFTRKSLSRQGGVADIIHSPGDYCWGVVFDVEKDDLIVLDCKEGVKYCTYKRLELADGMITYDVVKKIYFVQPHPTYVNLIIEGAKHYGLPEDWIKILESYKTNSKS